MTKYLTHALGGAAVVAGLLASGVAPAGAEPIEREHYTFHVSDTITDTECGAPITVDYVADFSGLFMIKEGRAGDPTPYVFRNYSDVETFTANSKTFTLIHEGLYMDQHIELVEGTVYRITAIETGRPVSGIAPDGTKVNLDRGRIRFTFLVDTLGDVEPRNDVFLSDEGTDVAGPHPALIGEADFCDLLDALR